MITTLNALIKSNISYGLRQLPLKLPYELKRELYQRLVDDFAMPHIHMPDKIKVKLGNINYHTGTYILTVKVYKTGQNVEVFKIPSGKINKLRASTRIFIDISEWYLDKCIRFAQLNNKLMAEADDRISMRANILGLSNGK